jgi:hypothetical protein
MAAIFTDSLLIDSQRWLAHPQYITFAGGESHLSTLDLFLSKKNNVNITHCPAKSQIISLINQLL